MSTSNDNTEFAIARLEAIEQEVAQHQLVTWFHRDEPHPYVQVLMPHTNGEVVLISHLIDDGARYMWGPGLTRSHSVADPAGATRRIVTELREEQRRVLAGCW